MVAGNYSKMTAFAIVKAYGMEKGRMSFLLPTVSILGGVYRLGWENRAVSAKEGLIEGYWGPCRGKTIGFELLGNHRKIRIVNDGSTSENFESIFSCICDC
ncbi:MAG: hypothetical protein V2B20_17895 [Pseudomonadota bacterium]